MSTAISVEHLTKTYRLGQLGGGTLQRDLARWWARMRGKPDPFAKIGQEQHARQVGELFWALDDVNFEVKQGEILGIIGRNGAGKSTLLKILSQVTSPTSGEIKVRGRIASLLEVGTGFHPELTGRENIFLNGAILGMTKAEIRRKFDEIVEFSECATFIDTPVKRYSSGMYVRLAFAVAAHLEPEILIVDEVLAVGDAQFQNKCLGKMGEVSRGGRTVLFVSHNMGAVRRLCRTAVLLDGGKVLAIENAETAVGLYLGAGLGDSAIWRRTAPVSTSSPVSLTEVRVTDRAGRVANVIGSTEPVIVHIQVHVSMQTRPMQVALRLTNHEGIPIFSSTSTDEVRALLPMGPGTHVFSVEIPSHLLAPGTYNIGVAAHIPRVTLFDFTDAINFTVEDTGTGFNDERLGVVTPRLGWTHSTVPSADGVESTQCAGVDAQA